MREGRTVVLPVVALLLGAMRTSAQFDGLASFNPQQIADTISNKAPEQLASEVIHAGQPQELVASAAKAIREGPKEHVVKAVSTLNVAKESAAGAYKDSGSSSITTAMQGAKLPVPQDVLPSAADAISRPSQSGAGAPATAAPTVEVDHRAPPEKAAGAPDAASAKEAGAGALKDAVTKGLLPEALKAGPEALKTGTLETAHASLKSATEAIASTDTDALQKAGQGLAHALNIPHPSQVHEEVKKSSPEAANWLEQALNHVSHVELPKPQDVLKAAQPDGQASAPVGQAHLSPAPAPAPGSAEQVRREVIPTDDDDGQSSTGWLSVIVVIFLAGLSVAGGWHVFTSYKRRDVRSPTLLTDAAEMSAWGTRSGQQARCPSQAEETLFRQF